MAPIPQHRFPTIHPSVYFTNTQNMIFQLSQLKQMIFKSLRRRDESQKRNLLEKVNATLSDL